MKQKRYEVFCGDFSYIVYADSLMEAVSKFNDLFKDQEAFAVVEHRYLEGKFLKIGEVRDEGLAELF